MQKSTDCNERKKRTPKDSLSVVFLHCKTKAVYDERNIRQQNYAAFSSAE